MKNIITINTDSSFCQKTQIGAYAFWIKWKDFFYKWSGVFKDTCKWSQEAEEKAVLVAIWILKDKSKDFDIIVVNRDCIGVKNQGKVKKYIRGYKVALRDIYGTKERFVKFKWVKWHGNWETKRGYVNNWCDREARKVLREERKKFTF